MPVMPSWSFMDLIVWLLGLKIRTNLGEREKRYKDKEKKNWRNCRTVKKQGEGNEILLVPHESQHRKSHSRILLKSLKPESP